MKCLAIPRGSPSVIATHLTDQEHACEPRDARGTDTDHNVKQNYPVIVEELIPN